MRTALITAAMVVGGALLAATPGAAQRGGGGPSPAQVRQLQPALNAAARDAGYAGVAGAGKVGALAADSSETWQSQSTTAAGAQVAVVGACLEGCTSLHLRVLAPNGDAVGTDTRTTTQPVVQFTAPAAGRYRVVVTMAACSSGRCAYGIKFMSRAP